MGLMGMVFRTAAVVVLIALTSCTPKKVVRNVNKYYVACCDPGLNAEDKDMCKWMAEKGVSRLYRGGDIYEGVWSDCKPGGEPWRKWE